LESIISFPAPSRTKMQTLLLVEDTHDVGESFSLVMESFGWIVLWKIDRTSAIDFLKDGRPDVCLVDLGLPDGSGLDVVERTTTLAIPTLVWTVDGRATSVSKALQAGASGYSTKEEAPQVLDAALRAIMTGGTWLGDSARNAVLSQHVETPNLTPRELDLIRGLARGMTYQEVADSYDLGLGTVQRYVRHLYEKLHITSKAELAAFAVRAGILGDSA